MDRQLVELFNKRTGGSVNIRGIQFQLYYACSRLLNAWFDGGNPENITLEGIEDLDINYCRLQFGESEYVQLKTSQNKMTAADFWGTNVIQNFYQAYLLHPTARFKLVYNMDMAKGGLSEWVDKGKVDSYWIAKLDLLFPGKASEEWETFLKRITFERHSVKTLKESSEKAIITHFGINIGAEAQYFSSLLYCAIEWSKNRSAVTKTDLFTAIQDVSDGFSKQDKNPAIANNWITITDYALPGKDDDFFYDGAAAKPHHIVQKLPARRKTWENEIELILTSTDVVVIRSSSGQGKSTLAWQAGYNLSREKYTVFQLNSCRNADEIATLEDFLKTRIKIGVFPVVIIDGLDLQKSDWYHLTERLSSFPVKFIVTCRQEDWYRYGADLSRVSLKTVELKLSMSEAKDIYNQLKSKGKLHTGIKNWQEPWETVAEKGLLIEYVYLLTQGDMLRSRLGFQIRKLAEERDSACILEILRLVSVANSMTIILRTSALSRQIQSEIGFQTDRGEVYKRLEKEYHLKCGEDHVEGFHPVRSGHLIEILHEYVPVSETLLRLFNIIEPEYHQIFFNELQNLELGSNVDVLLDHLSENIVRRSFPEMTSAMKGLFQAEAKRYLEGNRAIFDEAFKRGGLVLFVADTLPFDRSTFIKDIASTLSGEMRVNLDALISLNESLSQVNLKESFLRKFASHLQKHLSARKDISDIQGLSDLNYWFDQLGMELPLSPAFDYERLAMQMKNDEVSPDYVKELFYHGHRNMHNSHKTFLENNKQLIISWLRLKTNSLSLSEVGRDILISYIIEDGGKEVNKQSVGRIELVHSILPGYEHYRTEGCIFPYPGEELVRVTRESAEKNIAPEMIVPPYNPQINNIWASQLELPYRCVSAYDWQCENFKFREIALAFVKSCTLLFEAHLEVNNDKLNRVANRVVVSTNELTGFFAVKRKSPLFQGAMSQVDISEKAINDWCLSLTNFARQFPGIFHRIGKSAADAGRLPLYNLKEAADKIAEMQAEYNNYVENTYPYCPADELCAQERDYFRKLVNTVEMYIENADLPNLSQIRNAKQEVFECAKRKKQKRLSLLKSILRENSIGKRYSLIPPDFINDEGNLKEASIAMKGIGPEDTDEIVTLFMSLTGLLKTGIDFFHFVFLKSDSKAYHAVRISSGYLENMLSVMNGQDPSDLYAHPFPMGLSEKVLFGLTGVAAAKITNEAGDILYSIFNSVWNLLQFRLYAKSDNELDRKYSREHEDTFSFNHNKEMVKLKACSSPDIFSDIERFLNEIVGGNQVEFNGMLLEKLNQILKETVSVEDFI